MGREVKGKRTGSKNEPDARAWPVPELSAVDVAFPANALDWMPAWDQIPDEFKQRRNEWAEIASSWFFNGLPANVEFHAREGIDAEAAFRAVSATLGSFAPKHEHKEAAAAFMLACWFKRVKNWKP